MINMIGNNDSVAYIKNKDVFNKKLSDLDFSLGVIIQQQVNLNSLCNITIHSLCDLINYEAVSRNYTKIKKSISLLLEMNYISEIVSLDGEALDIKKVNNRDLICIRFRDKDVDDGNGFFNVSNSDIIKIIKLSIEKNKDVCKMIRLYCAIARYTNSFHDVGYPSADILQKVVANIHTLKEYIDLMVANGFFSINTNYKYSNGKNFSTMFYRGNIKGIEEDISRIVTKYNLIEMTEEEIATRQKKSSDGMKTYSLTKKIQSMFDEVEFQV